MVYFSSIFVWGQNFGLLLIKWYNIFHIICEIYIIVANYESITEEGDCIFCKIGQGKIKPMGDAIIYENDNYMAWLSPFPNTQGFTVVIPRKHFDSDVLQMPGNELQEFMLFTKKVIKLLIEYFSDVGRVGLIIEGTGINHAHIKLFPMHGTEGLDEGEWKQFHSDNDKYFSEYEGYISSHDGPKADYAKLQGLATKIKKKTNLS